MRISVSMWSVVSAYRAGTLDIPGFIHFAQQSGAAGVELLDFFWKDQIAESAAVDAALRETGLSVTAYAVSNDFVNTDAAVRAAQVEKIKAGVDMALHYGSQRVRVFSGDVKPDMTFEQGRAWIIDGLSAAAAYAHSHGVILALENHGKLAGRSDQVRSVIEAVNSPGLRANFDTGNFVLVMQNPSEAALELAPLTGYVHLKDFRQLRTDEPVAHSYGALDGSRFQGTVIGQGDVDLPTVLTRLRAGGYDDWLAIEYEGHGDPLHDVPASVAASLVIIAALG